MTVAALTRLAVYPVKSCRGIAVSRASIAARGLVLAHSALPAGDREWMIVDEGGRFISQREVPLLALVETAITGEALQLSMRGRASIDVPLDSPRGATREVVVWSSTVPAHDAGPEVASWLAGEKRPAA